MNVAQVRFYRTRATFIIISQPENAVQPGDQGSGLPVDPATVRRISAMTTSPC
jgi:hypothetical protein